MATFSLEWCELPQDVSQIQSTSKTQPPDDTFKKKQTRFIGQQILQVLSNVEFNWKFPRRSKQTTKRKQQIYLKLSP